MLVFEITDEQEKKFEAWRKKLEKKIPCPYVGAVGGAYAFEFIQTGLGVITMAKRSDGHEINLTDFSKW